MFVDPNSFHLQALLLPKDVKIDRLPQGGGQAMPKRNYNSHYGNGVPAMFTS